MAVPNGVYPCEPKPGLASGTCPVFPSDYDTAGQPNLPQVAVLIQDVSPNTWLAHPLTPVAVTITGTGFRSVHGFSSLYLLGEVTTYPFSSFTVVSDDTITATFSANLSALAGDALGVGLDWPLGSTIAIGAVTLTAE